MKRSFFSLIVIWFMLMSGANAVPEEGYEDFVFTIDSTVVGGANPTPSFPIHTVDELRYNYTVECDDENPGTNATNATGVTGDHWCEYESEGTHTIRISGEFPRIYFYDGASGAPYAQRLLSVEQWGTTAWTSMQEAFRGCSNMVVNASDNPNLSNVTDMSRMFLGASKLTFTHSINDWDISTVENMFATFENARIFNEEIGNWNTSSVTEMENMFAYAIRFNQDIGDWNTSAVIDMNEMFRYTWDFNQDISAWDTSRVISMDYMFIRAKAFNQDISAWDTSSVTGMKSMFYEAQAFNQNLATWNVEKVISFKNMFKNIKLDTRHWDAMLIAWDAQNVKSGVDLGGGNSHYCHAESARAHLVSSDDWNITDGGLDCTGTEDFIITVQTDNNGTSSDTQFTIPTRGSGYNYNVDCDNDGTNEATAQTGDYTCNYATPGTYTIRIKDNEGDDTGFPNIYFNNTGDKEKLLRIEQWGTGKWKSMSSAFYGCLNLVVTAVDNPDLSNVLSMFGMFERAEKLTFTHSINDWDTSNVEYMDWMFTSAEVFNQDISDWNTSAVKRMDFMFHSARAFNQNISSWNIENVTTFQAMFANVYLDTDIWDAILIAWDAQAVQNGARLDGGGSHYCQGESARAHLISVDGWTITDAGKECIAPDYIPKLTAQGTIIAGANGTLSLVVRVGEFANANNSEGDVAFTIVKNANLSLLFDPTEITRQGKVMQNALWSKRETSALYIFTYNGTFPAGTASRLGLSGVFTSPENTKGQFTLDVTIVGGTGEIVSGNNKDSDILEYNNL